MAGWSCWTTGETRFVVRSDDGTIPPTAVTTWTACPDCSPLVTTRDMPGLIGRTHDGYRRWADSTGEPAEPWSRSEIAVALLNLRPHLYPLEENP